MWKFFGKKEAPTRQPRIDAEISVNFRKISEFSWNVGKTSNISKSGALFRAVQRLGESTPIELEFVAPELFGEDAAGQLVACRGKIVRMLPPPPNDRRASMAVHFSKLAVVRRPGDW